jgi:hypothetical protein
MKISLVLGPFALAASFQETPGINGWGGSGQIWSFLLATHTGDKTETIEGVLISLDIILLMTYKSDARALKILPG